MHVGKKLAQEIGEFTQGLDKRIQRTLSEVILTACRARTLSVTRLGRHLGGNAQPKHAIKRVDRLLSNSGLQRGVDGVYGALIEKLILPGSRPVILVDWTESGPHHYALGAALAVGGRAIPIRCEVYARKYVNNSYREHRLLRRLHRQLPVGCRPIVVTDAGFQTPWFRAVARLGWDFVGRLSCQLRVKPFGSDAFVRVDSLYTRLQNHIIDHGMSQVTQRSKLQARLVQFKGKPKGRHGATRRTRKGTHPKAPAFAKCQKRGCEPWMLVTSLANVQAATVVKYYSARMQIEESFRDSKNHRYGLCFEDVRCQSSNRAQVLWLLCALALYITNLIGTLVEQQGAHYAWQANTTRHRRVLSRFVLGLLTLQSSNLLPIEQPPWQQALRTLQYACKLLHLHHLPAS